MPRVARSAALAQTISRVTSCRKLPYAGYLHSFLAMAPTPAPPPDARNPQRSTGSAERWRSARFDMIPTSVGTSPPEGQIRTANSSRSTARSPANSAKHLAGRKYRQGHPGKATIAIGLRTFFGKFAVCPGLADSRAYCPLSDFKARLYSCLRKRVMTCCEKGAAPYGTVRSPWAERHL